MTRNPQSEYAVRLEARRHDHRQLETRDARLGHGRLAVFGIGLLIAWLAFVSRAIHPGALAAPAIAFVALAWHHAHVIRRRDRAMRAIVFYERGLARLEDRWAGGGEPGERLRLEGHPYADDLDLFGAGSLFELLSVARTRAGEETLAAWLTHAAEPDEVKARQEAVREMVPLLDLRESLAMAGADVRAGVLSDALTAWAGAPRRLAGWAAPVAWALSVSTVAAFGWWIAGGPGFPLLATIAMELVFTRLVQGAVTQVLHGSGRPVRDLDVLAHALEHLERVRFDAPRLVRTCAPVVEDGAASTAIRRLHRLSEMHDWQHNIVFAPVAALLLWGPHLACAIERWRARHGAHIAAWLAAVGEIEAFSSLATYSYERPADPFPEIVPGPGMFEATGLGHPLLPTARMVRNDVRLSGELRMLVVSGSNMSGKSTLLRTVGINAVLALAGAPVRAAHLRLSPVAVGATLTIQDSLQEGRSRFYAEITRLRLVADLTRGPVPVLYLLDELFHGTNSHDRLLGATGVLRSLSDAGAIGLVTTHDLALTAVANELAPLAANVHFEDRFEGGEMSFDYTMRDGPVTHSNALALMRAVGLDVPGTPEPPDTD